ncbi:hypothetical protein LZ30DRAFT_724931 [Colletotrichum cereale]|nr:hypothetical protein LZ30DRAFT_724931 [Colletotrichum cereale]
MREREMIKRCTPDLTLVDVSSVHTHTHPRPRIQWVHKHTYSTPLPPPYSLGCSAP